MLVEKNKHQVEDEKVEEKTCNETMWVLVRAILSVSCGCCGGFVAESTKSCLAHI